jgi:ferredoxin-NADP reductase
MIETSTQVLRVREETPSVRSILLAKPDGFWFEVSQAMMLTLASPAGMVRRPFSIASAPGRDYLEFAARRSESDFKRAFFALQPGDHVGLRGPRGEFFLERHRPAVLIAGGIGITPLKSMIEYATDEALSTQLVLVYGNRSPEEIVFRDDLDALAQANAGLRVVQTVTESSPDWSGRVGRIDAALLGQVARDVPTAFHYIAGPPRFVQAIYATLASLDVPIADIRIEMFRGYE